MKERTARAQGDANDRGRAYRCTKCNRVLRNRRWVYSKATRARFCFPGEGCQKKKGKGG